MSLDLFARAYLHAMAFTEDPKPGQGEYPRPNYDRDFETRVLVDAERDCDDFQAAVERAGLSIAADVERAGRDFWYTRNGHGAGFWDGDWPKEDAEVLTALAHTHGEYYVERRRGKFRKP